MSRKLSRAVAAAAALLAYGCGAAPGERAEDGRERGEHGDGAPPLVALEELTTPAAPGSGQPNLTAGPGGRVYLTWLEPTDSARHALRMAILEPGAPEPGSPELGTPEPGSSEPEPPEPRAWSPPTTIATGADFFVNWADFPSLAALPDGSLAAHWLVRTGRGAAYDIHLARSTDGGVTWSSALTPHRDGTVSEHGFVSLIPEPDGGVTVVWLDGRGYATAEVAAATSANAATVGDHDAHGEMALLATTIGPDGALGEEIVLDARTCDCCQTAAAWTAAGPIVAYRDRTADEVRDVVVTRRVDGRWTEPRTVHDDGWTIAACPVNGPALAAEGNRVAVAWFTAARDTPRVRIAFSDDAGATFSPPIDVDDGAPAGRVGLALLQDGAALVSWIERVAGSAEVRVRRIAPAVLRGSPTRADPEPLPESYSESLTIATSSAERASGFPRMTRVGNQIVIAWTDPARPSRVHTVRATIP